MMIFAIVIGVLLFLGAIWLHIGMLALARMTYGGSAVRPLRFSAAYLIVLMSHLLIALEFAAGFKWSHSLGLGGFVHTPGESWMDLFYFSLVNITTLGLGDIYPTGHVRALAGIESLTGFLLISCTAQFIFETLHKPATATG